MLKHQALQLFGQLDNISNFHPLEVVSRYRDPQLQVGENFNYMVISALIKDKTIFRRL